MKKLIGLLLLVFMVGFNSYEAVASHVAGGNIKYNYLGPGSTPGTYKYKIRLGIIRDCNGIGYTSTTENLTLYCTQSNSTINITARKVNYQPKPGERPANNGARDVSDVCRNKASRCTGNRNPGGYEEIIYEAIVDLTPCNRWQMWLRQSICCRNGMANGNGSTFSPHTELNNWDFPTNSSPNFADEVKPMPSVCVGQDVFYGIGTIDPDGDSLVFKLVRARVSQNGPFGITYVNYTNGASFSNPIPNSNFRLDSLTGLISFKTSNTGKYLVAFEVIEYDRCNFREKGRTHREVQFDVRACSNNVPRDISGISALTGKAIQLGKYSLEVCEGETITWVDTILDRDPTDTLRFASNVDSVLTDVKWTVTSLARNKAIVKFEWRAFVDQGQFKTFFLSFDDDRCDFPGNGFSVFNILVRPAASAGEDMYVCKGDTASIRALGGDIYNWRVIYGDPLVPGLNWFPDTFPGDTNGSVKFIPSQHTMLEVFVANIVDNCGRPVFGNCFKRDSIIIYSPDSFSTTMTPDSFFLCNPGKGQMNVNVSKPFNFSYAWDNESFLNNDTIKDPGFSGITVPTTFTVTVTSDSGCVKEDEVFVSVTDPFPTNLKAMASDTLVCLQKTIDLWVNKGSINYGGCDTMVYRCQGDFKNYYSGAGSITSPANNIASRSYASTYSTANVGQKSQYLYLATDLKRMGVQPGPIKSIGFEIASLYLGSSAPINGFAIKMGCTKLVDIPLSQYISGTKEVYAARSIFPSLGWNDHTLDVPYVWDGVSNLVIEICWDNTGFPVNGSHQQTFDRKSYRAAASYYRPSTSTFYNDACGNTSMSSGFPNSLLPRTRFNACTGMRSSLFKFDWDPKSNGGFVGATNKDSVLASVNLSTAKTYTVYVQDSAYGVCFDTLTVDVTVRSQYDVKPDSIDPQCISNGFILLNSPTPHWVTNPGGKWTGAGIINDSIGIWDPIKSGKGKFWVTYEVKGDACENIDSTEIEVVGNPDPSLLSPDSLCGIYGGTGLDSSHILLPKIPGGWFTGFGVDSAAGPNGMVYYVDGTQFRPQTGNPDTAIVKYTLTDGCTHDSTFKIPVVAPWDHTFLGVLDHGVPYSTTQFCASYDFLDTLVVAGPDPVWFYNNDTSAMVDRNLGVFDPKIAGAENIKDEIGQITVGNYGFCGTDTTFNVVIVTAPEVKLEGDTTYCFEERTGALRNSIDTMMVRIPLGSNNPAYKKLGHGRDTLVTYASITASDWTLAYMGANQYTYHFWEKQPWMNNNNIARFQKKQVPVGKNKLKYQFAYYFRDNFPARPNNAAMDKRFCYSRDSINVHGGDEIEVPRATKFNFCVDDTISGFYVKPNPRYGSDYNVMWHASKAAGSDTLGNIPVDSSLLYHPEMTINPAGDHNLYVRYIHKESGCLSAEKNASGGTTFWGEVPYRLYNYPEVSFTTDPENDTTAKYEGATVTYLNNTAYSDTNIAFEWRYDEATGSGYTKQVVPHRLGEPDERITVQYNLFGRPSVMLWGVNDVGCADSIFWQFGVEKSVRLAWPNVFTPGEDGYNDWWYVLSSDGNGSAEPLPGVCIGADGVEHNYCPEGEQVLLDWFDKSFDKFEGYIYDRWGRKVYTLTKESPIWKGQNTAGGDLTDGVYMYSIRWKPRGLDTKEEVQEGTITLIREK